LWDAADSTLVHDPADEVYSIQTFNLTKLFRKRRHYGIFGFLRKNARKRELFDKKEEITMALDHVNVSIRSGELFGLLGPNGAGKTTLIKCLSTTLIPDEGTAVVNGFDIKKQATMVRSSIGLVIGGERTLYWKLTAKDNLLYFASLYKIPRKQAKERVDKLLALMNLSDRADERLEDYSTGMRQKVAIARALLHDPPVLLFDEPTLGLDPTFARQIRILIRELCRKEGKTVLLTTHYMGEADEMCDRIAIIKDGKIIAVDTPTNLKAMVKETELVELSCYNLPHNIEDRLRALCPDVEVITVIHGEENEGNPSRVKIMGGSAEKYVGTVVDTIHRENARIINLRIGVPTLEDVFIKLTGAKLAEGGKTER
jgi:ABC-2 type transport system ATP-binding protein